MAAKENKYILNDTYYIIETEENNKIVYKTNIADNTGATETTYEPGSMTYQYIRTCVESICDKSKNMINTNKRIQFCIISSFDIKDEAIISTRYFNADSFRAFRNQQATPIVTQKVQAAANSKEGIDAIDKLIKFFTEWHFKPGFRFVNSLCLADNPKEFVKDYFYLQDHPYKEAIKDKLESHEFTDICNVIKKFHPEPINHRLEVFYGDPGTGKTTKAKMLAEDICGCSSDTLPSDLMRTLEFEDGKPGFKKVNLWTAMEEGKVVALDEINMLPFESLRFLQILTDNKDTLDWNGHKINIHPNFKIIATMNLNVAGQCIPLPEPLVDRCSNMKEFTLTAADLFGAIADA